MVDDVLNAHIEYVLDTLGKMKAGTVRAADVDRARCDNLCRIGRWLETVSDRYMDNIDYIDVCATHSKFHNDLSRILERYLGGDRDVSIEAVLAITMNPNGCFGSIAGKLQTFCGGVDGETKGMF